MTHTTQLSLRSLLAIVTSAAAFSTMMACGKTASIDDRPCPCTDGYRCCATTNRCVASGDVCADAGGPTGQGDSAITPDGGEVSKDGSDRGVLQDATDSTPLRVFVTSTLYNGNLGGLSGADASCTTVAQKAGVSGKWVAFLAGSSTQAIDRVKGDGPWYLMDRKTLAFANRSALTIDPRALDQDESGQEYAPAYVWTGTNPYYPSTNCTDWTTTSGTGTYVYSESIYTNITDDPCTTLHSLICFEQP
ncbi:MAG TPA: DUF1554 domain-containing protein [Labilithrix sp.]|nr:DUF1554 domain-containing protein [Labilithrix sp.]